MKGRLDFLYGRDKSAGISDRIQRLIQAFPPLPAVKVAAWSEKDVFLITYADTLTSPGRPSIQVLDEFLRRRAGGLITLVHLLPFYPFTSDDGFAVTDFRKVRPDIGAWEDIRGMGQRFRLCFDGVVNHVSAHSVYMKGYSEGNPAYSDFFISLDPGTDTRSVLRTRGLPLLHPFQTPAGEKWLWTTFGPDQADLNYRNPGVLLEILGVLLFYVKNGASVIRLDAVPYLWKKLGTSCAHLAETHELIKLIRAVLGLAAPRVLLLAETNAPFEDNTAYLGKGDEAHMIYNFNLAPLILYSIVKGDASYLTRWAGSMKPVPPGTTFLNVTATHDGIGMRPTEGILPESARRELVRLAYDRKGEVTGRKNSDGSISPYELNLNYFDAVNGPGSDEPVDAMVRRFMLSQAIPLAFKGIPGIYIQSLLGSRSNFEGMKQSGRARSINRQSFDCHDVENELDDPGHLRHKVFCECLRLLEIRKGENAFHPDAPQEILDQGPGLFILRRAGKEGITAAYNVTAGERNLALPAGRYLNLLSGRTEAVGVSGRPLAPLDFVWLKMRF